MKEIIHQLFHKFHKFLIILIQEIFQYRKKFVKINPNSCNTVTKFFSRDEQFVKNLNFYDPNIYNECEEFDIAQKTSYKLFNVVKHKIKIENSDKNKNDGINNYSRLSKK